MSLDEIFSTDNYQPSTINQKASFLARLGSGSACRSLYNGLVVWGKTDEVEGSSDLYAVKYPDSEIHPIFKNFNDWVLLIHEGQKTVSSTVGHGLMNTNPYAERRFQEARENFVPLKEIFKTGDLQGFIKLVEHEALTLHAMMMMSEPAFILMKTGTLEVINKLWKFREETGNPLFFTLDAGANVHLLFPENESTEAIKKFIETELLEHTQKGGVVKDVMRF
jgi:diphosphomevalonate decarboxylase